MTFTRIEARNVDPVKRSQHGEPLNVGIRLFDDSKLVAVIELDSLAKVRRLYESLGNFLINHAEDMEAEL